LKKKKAKSLTASVPIPINHNHLISQNNQSINRSIDQSINLPLFFFFFLTPKVLVFALLLLVPIAKSVELVVSLIDSTNRELASVDVTQGDALNLLELDAYNASVSLRVAVGNGNGNDSSAYYELSLVRSASLLSSERAVNGSLAADDLDLLTFSSVLAAGATATLNLTYACRESFLLRDAWVALLRDANGSVWQTETFAWTKQCFKRGCAERCSDHGTCDDFLGQCTCDDWWFGDDCQFRFKMPTRVCPGDVVPIEWFVPGDRSTVNDWYSIYPADFDDVFGDAIEWRYFYTKSTLWVQEAPSDKWLLNDSTTFQLAGNQAPGRYINFYFPDGIYEKSAEITFDVLSWDECNKDGAAAACAASPPCSGHGSCDGGNLCKCTEQFFWFDCSRGCSEAPALLTAMNGSIDTGAYNNEIQCIFDIVPAEPFDEIALDVTKFSLDEGDLLRIERRYDEAVDGPMRMATRAPLSGMPAEQNGKAFTADASPGFVIVSDFVWTAKPDGVLKVPTDKGARVLLLSDKWNVAGGITVKFAASKAPRVLSGGEIAGIVVGSFVAAALLAALMFGCYVVAKRRSAERAAALQRAANAPSLSWEPSAELLELPANRRTDATDVSTIAVGSVAQVASLVRASEERSLFMGDKRGRVKVGVTVSDGFTLTNTTNRALSYSVFAPRDESAFECCAVPGVGVLAAGEQRTIACSLTLNYTTKVWTFLKVTFADADGAYFVPILLEGDSSLRLDPDAVDLLGKPLGDGAYGVVYRGRYRGADVAVKVAKHQAKSSAQDASFLTEVTLFEKLRSPYIVNFIGASHVPGKQCILTELCPRGSAAKLLAGSKLSTALKTKMALDCAEVVAFLHENGVIYRDLKLDNLLVVSISVTAAVNVKLGDFGTALTVKDPFAVERHSRGVGTPIYMAPELMLGKKTAYNCQCDVYSLALLIWELLAEKAPFASVARAWDLPDLVLGGARPVISDSWPAELKDVINKGWLSNPASRPTSAEMVALLKVAFGAAMTTHVSGDVKRKSTKAVRERDQHGNASATNTNTASPNASLNLTASLLERSGSGSTTGNLTSRASIVADMLAPALDAKQRPSTILQAQSERRKWKATLKLSGTSSPSSLSPAQTARKSSLLSTALREEMESAEEDEDEDDDDDEEEEEDSREE
jgi:serine/threonine protein kinase